MSEILFYLLENSLFIIGLRIITSEGMIFERAGNIIREFLGEFWSKPVISCAPCMASVWGTAFYFTFVHGTIYFFPVYVLSLAGINYLIMKNLDK